MRSLSDLQSCMLGKPSPNMAQIKSSTNSSNLIALWRCCHNCSLRVRWILRLNFAFAFNFIARVMYMCMHFPFRLYSKARLSLPVVAMWAVSTWLPTVATTWDRNSFCFNPGMKQGVIFRHVGADGMTTLYCLVICTKVYNNNMKLDVQF